MICPTCQGSFNQFNPCRTCNGLGLMYCCEGECEQPDKEEDRDPQPEIERGR